MTSSRDVDLVVAAAEAWAPLEERGQRWAHLSLCVLDAVFSIGAHYSATSRTVRDYAEHAGLAHVLEPAGEVAAGAFADAEEPVSALRKRIEAHGPAEFAETVLRNRQRTSSRGGVLKAEAALRYAAILERHGVHRLGDVPALLADDWRLGVEGDLGRVPGHGAHAIRTGYLWMLAGSDTAIKPDRMVLGWLRQVLGRTPSVPEARELVDAAAGTLEVTPWQLDRAIWSAQRAIVRRGHAPTPLGPEGQCSA